MAALAAGLEVSTGAVSVGPPPKLVRQKNCLSWQAELGLNGFVVVSESVLLTFDENIIVNGTEVVCPPGHIILVNAT